MKERTAAIGTVRAIIVLSVMSVWAAVTPLPGRALTQTPSVTPMMTTTITPAATPTSGTPGPTGSATVASPTGVASTPTGSPRATNATATATLAGSQTPGTKTPGTATPGTTTPGITATGTTRTPTPSATRSPFGIGTRTPLPGSGATVEHEGCHIGHAGGYNGLWLMLVIPIFAVWRRERRMRR